MGPHSEKKETDPPLSNITNGSKPPQIDNLSNQILSLTSIATQLQKEMSQLSRRSRDNAADLLSLKEATNTRDEDIRKSLRDLLGNMNEARQPPAKDSYRGLYLDNQPHNASPNVKGFHLPRIPSPKSFSDSIDRASMSTPSLAGSEAGPSVLLLEKIIRDMGTKEGQDTLLDRLAEISHQMAGMATAEKIDELAEFVKANAERALTANTMSQGDDEIRGRSFHQADEHNGFELALNQHRPGAVAQRIEQLMRNEGRAMSQSPARGSELVTDDLMNIIRSVKDSVAQGGGLTAEVKALVRELRGEVLGMGREIGKRLEEQQASRKDAEDNDTPSKDEVARVIDEGLEQMKDQLNHVLREHRRQSANSISSQKMAVDYQEIYNAMRAALRDNEASKDLPDLSREDVIEAVRDAWENYKPEIEVQQLGLEREEVLACLKEGLQDYSPQDERPQAATREEVFKAVVEGLKHFVPPRMDTPASLSRDEIIEAVRDCLEEFEFPVAESAPGPNDLTREDMVHAVKEGLHDLDLSSSRALVTQSNNDDLVDRLHDLMEYMKLEFKAVSEEAKENVAANGRDTEQVLDATKDGFESLRMAIESYVDRATGVAGQEEFMEGLLKSMDDFKDEIADLVANATEDSREQLKTELEGLRDVVNSSMVPATPPAAGNAEIMEALHTGLNGLRQEILRPRAETSEILDALNDGLNDLRAGIDRVTNKPVDLTANDEILDALRDGLGAVHADIETLRESSNNKAIVAHDAPPAVDDEVLKTLKSGLESLRSDIESLRDSTAEKAVVSSDESADKASDEILATLKTGLESVRSDIEALRETERSAPASNGLSGDEVLGILKNGLESVRASIENLKESNAQKSDNSHNPSEEVLEGVKSGLEALRSDIEALRDGTTDRSADTSKTLEILDTLKTSLESVRSDIETLKDCSADKALVTLDSAPNDEVLSDVKVGLAAIRSDIEALRDYSAEKSVDPAANAEVLDTLKSGLETLRSDIETLRDSGADKALATLGSGPDDDTLNGLKTGLDSIKADIEALRASNADRAVDPNANAEVLDALKAGLDSVRSDIESLRENNSSERAVVSANQSAGDELLSALRSGIESLRSDIEALRDNNSERALATITTENGTNTVVLPDDVPRQKDIRNLEGLMSQLQASVAGIEPAANADLKDGFRRLEDMLSSVKKAVEDIHLREGPAGETSAREVSSGSDNASKEDVEAIETILRNTKARLDDLMDGEQAIRKDHVDALEALVLETRDSISAINSQMEALSRKEDVAPLESLVSQITVGFEEIKDRANKESENPDKLSRLDIEALGTVLDDIKNTLDGLTNNTDFSALSTKEEITKLEGSIDEVKAKLDENNESHSKALAVRDSDMTSVGERVDAVKSFLEEFQETLKTKLEEGSSGVDGVSKLLEALGEKVDKNENVGADLKEMFETMKTEFEDSKGIVAGARIESDEKVQAATDSLALQFDEKIGGLIAKYEEFQLMLDEKSKLAEARDAETEAAVIGTKAVADELKLLTDTLGATVTDSLEKMEEASKTVFSQVEELVTKTEEHHAADKTEHEQTREKIVEALALVEILKGEMGENHPKVIEAVKDVMFVVGDHVENTKSSIMEIQEKLDDAKPSEHMRNLLPPEKYDNTEVLEKLGKVIEEKYDDAAVQEKLDKLSDKITEEKYDDAAINEKLDKLIEGLYDDAAVHERLEKLSEKIVEEKYDDTVVKEKLDKLIDEKYDDAEVREKLDKIIEDKYDDILVHEKLDKIVEDKYDDILVHEKLDKIIEDRYDDILIHEKLDKIVDGKYDDAEVRSKLDKIIEESYNDAVVQEKLDKIIEDRYDDILVHEKLDKIVESKYDDAVLQSKLDKLVDHSGVAEQAFTQLATLDQVHESVLKTASELTMFLANQTQRVNDENEERAKALHETNVALERKLAEKEHAEASVLSLRDEEERLRKSVLALRTEQESLIRQKTRLTGDLSSLETAMQLRKEELYDMESRAEGLERRILEGVMDHSRVLLMAKSSRAHGDAMSRKRVRKMGNDAEAPLAARKPAVNMALAAKRSLAPSTQAGAARRIVSLSQINNNVASGGVKRSQSVRTPLTGKGLRKSSWNSGTDKTLAEDDKENMGVRETVEELDEPETPMAAEDLEYTAHGNEESTVDIDGAESDTGTLRRGEADDYNESDAEYSDYGTTESEPALEGSNEVTVYGQEA